MIEPTETESKETLDAFCDAMIEICREAELEPDLLHNAPTSQVVGRLDETAAVKRLDVRSKHEPTSLVVVPRLAETAAV